MTTATALNLRAGQHWLTSLGDTVRISCGPSDAGDEYPIYAIYVGGQLDGAQANFSRDGESTSGDRLVEILPDPKADALASYIADVLADELTLAELLGWKNFGPPEHFNFPHKMYGSHDKVRGHVARDCLVPMPQWRRSTDAAALISRCKLAIAPTDGGVAVHAETGPVVRAIYTDHPTEDHAIWFAICKAAIAYLGAK